MGLLATIGRLPPVAFWRRFSAAGPGVLASAVAYNLFFALVPTAVAVLAAASFFGRDEQAKAETLDVLQRIAPADVARFVSDALAVVSDQMANRTGTVIVVSALVASFFGARGVVTIQRVLARIEKVEEHRPWWLVRLVAMALTVGIGLALALSSLLLVTGEWIAVSLATLSGQEWVRTTWLALRIPVGSAGLLVFLMVLYHWGPPRPLPGAWLASLLAAGGMVGASLGFRAYLGRIDLLSGTIAVAGAVAVLLLWLYIMAYVIILAAAVGASTVRWWQLRRAPRNVEFLRSGRREESEEDLTLGVDAIGRDIADSAGPPP